MAAFNFPNSPSTNDLHTENNVTWKWNGTVWKRINNSYLTASTLDVTGISTFGATVYMADKLGHLTDTNTAIRFPTLDTITAETNGSERVRILSNGKVVVGDTNSDAQLGVYRASYNIAEFCNNNADATGAEVALRKDSSSPADGDTLGILKFIGDNDAGEKLSFAYVVSKAVDVTDGTEDGRLEFHTRAAGTIAERVRIDSIGNVLIGTTDTTVYGNSSGEGIVLRGGDVIDIARSGDLQLTLNRMSNDGPHIAFYRDGGVKSYISTRSNAFCIDVGGTSEKLRIDSSGCVRVGNTATQTTSSNTKRIALGAKGSIQGWTTGNLNGCVQLLDNYYWDGSNNKVIEADYCSYLSLRSGSLRFGSTNSSQTAGQSVSGGIHERLRIDSSGRLLIGSTSRAGDSLLQVYTSDLKHPAIRTNASNQNGYTMLSDAYQTDESQVNLGIAYSSASLVLSRGCKPSDSANEGYLSSQDTYSTRPCALRLNEEGALSFWTTETNATRTTDSAVTLTEVFSIDRVGNIRQKISNRFMYFGANQQLQVGVSGSDPYINSASGDLMIKDAGNGIVNVRSDGLQMFQDIYFATAGKGIVLGATSNVDANTLDDYEEGSWTPSVTYWMGNSPGSAGVPTVSSVNGKYVKIGKLVTCYCSINFSAGTSAGTSGYHYITGLPFSATNYNGAGNGGYGGGSINNQQQTGQVYVENTGVYGYPSSSTISQGTWYFNFHYFTDS